MSVFERPGAVRLFPSAHAGRGLPVEQAVRAWVTAAWLLAVEGRAYVEDLAGGADQPQLRQVVRMRLLELLLAVDWQLAGCAPPADEHQLALALEFGLGEVADLDGAELIRLFALDTGLGGDGADAVDDGAVPELWDRLCAAFPGALPDPLLASGQRAVLQALRSWSALCTAARIDASFLEPLLKDA